MSFLVPFVREKWYIFDERRYDIPCEDRTIYYMQILINKENSAGCLLDSNIIYADNSWITWLAILSSVVWIFVLDKNRLKCYFWMWYFSTYLSEILCLVILLLLTASKKKSIPFFPFNLFIHLTKDTLRVRELRWPFLGTQCSTFLFFIKQFSVSIQ